MTETTQETLADKKKPRREFKNKLKRGMTVKFQDNKALLNMVEKNNTLVRKY